MVYYKRSKIDNYRVGICWSIDHIQGVLRPLWRGGWLIGQFTLRDVFINI